MSPKKNKAEAQPAGAALGVSGLPTTSNGSVTFLGSGFLPNIPLSIGITLPNGNEPHISPTPDAEGSFLIQYWIPGHTGHYIANVEGTDITVEFDV